MHPYIRIYPPLPPPIPHNRLNPAPPYTPRPQSIRPPRRFRYPSCPHPPTLAVPGSISNQPPKLPMPVHT